MWTGFVRLLAQGSLVIAHRLTVQKYAAKFRPRCDKQGREWQPEETAVEAVRDGWR